MLKEIEKKSLEYPNCRWEFVLGDISARIRRGIGTSGYDDKPRNKFLYSDNYLRNNDGDCVIYTEEKYRTKRY